MMQNVIRFVVAIALLALTALSAGPELQYRYFQLSPHSSEVLTINGKGEVLGIACPSGCTAFLWDGLTQHHIVDFTFAEKYNVSFKLNARGVVAGARPDGDGTLVFTWSEQRGLREVVRLKRSSRITGFNDHGEIVGVEPINPDAAVMPDSYLSFFTTENGPIQYLSGNPCRAVAINDRGVVAGTLIAPCSSTTCSLGTQAQHAFVWTKKNGMRDLGTFDPSQWTDSLAADVNNSGEVAGVLSTSAERRVFIWSEKTGFTVPNCLGQCYSPVLNERGEIAGRLDGGRSFFWSAQTGMSDLGTFGGTTAANALNDRSQVVGSSISRSNGRAAAFVWTLQDGLSELDRGGVGIDINNHGTIAGNTSGCHPGMLCRAAIWEPVHVNSR